MRIEVCGGIASGKTTFTELIQNEKIKGIFEDFSANPFWEAFYANPGKYVFETELTFLLQHYHNIILDSENLDDLICDYSFVTDLAFAKIGLSGKKLDIFISTFNEILNEIGNPDIIVYLYCDASTQFQRIKRRARPAEKFITRDFLEKLNESIDREISQIVNSTKIVRINSAKSDFVNNDRVKEKLISKIKDSL